MRNSVTVAFITTLCGCAANAGSVSTGELQGHDDAEQIVLPSEMLSQWDLDGEWIDSAPIDAPEGVNRVAAMLSLGTADLIPEMQARLLVGGMPEGDWVPVEVVWSEHDTHVLAADFATIGDGAQVRVKTSIAEMVQQLRWAAELVDETGEAFEDVEAEEPEGDIGGSSDALSSELAAAGVVSRAAWGARATRCTSRNPTKNRMAIHHTVTGSANPERQVRAIQQYHMGGRGWCDVGYHFLIGIDGSIFEGRPVELLGSHVLGQNTGNIGISFVGCFNNSGCSSSWGPRRPPEVMICAAGRLANVLANRYGITIDSSHFKGHRHHSGASTSCPGEYLAARLGDLRSIASGRGCGITTPTPPPGPPSSSAGRCEHSFGGMFGDRGCSAGYQCCGGTWHTRDDGCGSCACTEESGTMGCEGAAPAPPVASDVSCVHSYGGTYPNQGCSTSYQCCDGAWGDRGSCGSCTCVEGSGTEGCSATAAAPTPASPSVPAGASCVHSYGGVYGNTACSAGWQCCDGDWRTRDEGCGSCACVEGSGETGCGVSACGEIHAGLSLGGSEIPRAGLANGTLERALGVPVEPLGDSVIVDGMPWVRGRVSWFGGPEDRSISLSGTGAITGERVRSLNSPVMPSASVLESRPADYYWFAMRFNYSPNGREYWRNARFVLRNPGSGASVVVRAVDWGPHTRTRRAVDLSPQAIADLGLVTDQDVLVAFARPGTPLGPTSTETCEPAADACAGHTACGSCNGAAGCGWCEDTGTCMEESRRSSCGEWRDDPSACEPCEATSCGACAGSGYCSWCPGVGCVNDSIPEQVAMCSGTPIASPSGC